MPDYKLVQIGPSSPRWYIQWQEGGRSRRASTHTEDRATAEERLAAFKLVQDAAPAETFTVSEALDFYILTRGQKIVTGDRAEYAAKHLKKHFGALPVSQADITTQESYIAVRRDQGAADETVRRELGVMSAAFHWSQPRKKLQHVPAVISLPASPPKERWLTRKEAAIIVQYFRVGGAKPHDQGARRKTAHLLLFTQLALYTGARSGAILDLTWDRVDLERRQISYPLPGKRQTAKGRSVITIETPLVRALKAAKLGSNSPYVITWRGEEIGRVARAFRGHMDLLGFTDVTPHTLRHTFATWAALKGVSMFLISRALGQKLTSTTERYAKHQPEALREVTRAVSRR